MRGRMWTWIIELTAISCARDQKVEEYPHLRLCVAVDQLSQPSALTALDRTIDGLFTMRKTS